MFKALTQINAGPSSSSVFSSGPARGSYINALNSLHFFLVECMLKERQEQEGFAMAFPILRAQGQAPQHDHLLF